MRREDIAVKAEGGSAKPKHYPVFSTLPKMPAIPHVNPSFDTT
jgi:hypothetical protein